MPWSISNGFILATILFVCFATYDVGSASAQQLHDDFSANQLDGRVAERGEWKFENNVATCASDPELYEKFKNHGPILKWSREFTDGEIELEFKPTQCHRAVFTLNGDGHVFRLIQANPAVIKKAAARKTQTRIIGWATKSSKENKGDTFSPDGLPDLEQLDGQWVKLKLVVRSGKAKLAINDFDTTIDHASLARPKNMIMLTFAHGEMSVRNFKFTPLAESNDAGTNRTDQVIAALKDPNDRSVFIAAHRGGYANDKTDAAPENSVANIDVAIKKGFEFYETDIRRTSDGAFVIVHNDSLEEETNGAGPVESMTLADVKKLKKRYRDGSLSNEPVATLEEFLTIRKGEILFKADMKPGVAEHFDELARLIEKHEMLDQIILRTGLKNAPAIKKCFEQSTPKVHVMFNAENTAQVKRVHKQFSPLTIQINLAKNAPLSTEKLDAIKTACELGIAVEMHCHNDPKLWSQMIDAGVRIFHTAVPDKTKKFMQDR